MMALMESRRQMSTRERILFASGDIFGGGGSALISVLYMFYLTDIMHISPGWAGTATLLPRIWDAVNNPLVGVWSDNTRTRWGRRRPWIVIGAPLLVLAMAAYWAPIGGWDSEVVKVLWVVGAGLFYTTVATVIAVPYGSLSTECSTDYDERSTVNILRLLFSTVSSAGATLVGSLLITQYTRGDLTGFELYLAIALGFGTLFALPALLAGLATRERTPIPTKPTRLTWTQMMEPLQLSSFRKLLGLYIAQGLAMDIIQALIVYYALYVVRANVTIFLGAFIVVNVIAFPIVNVLVKRVSKNAIYRTLLPLAFVAALGVAMYPPEWPSVGVYALGAVLAVGMCGSILMVWVMFPDVMDHAELVTGTRNAGVYSGLMTLIRGIATALALLILGWMLQWSGYLAPENYADPVQPDSVGISIRVTLAVAVIVIMGWAWWLAARYPLTLPECARMQEELAEQRGRTPGDQ